MRGSHGDRRLLTTRQPSSPVVTCGIGSSPKAIITRKEKETSLKGLKLGKEETANTNQRPVVTMTTALDAPTAPLPGLGPEIVVPPCQQGIGSRTCLGSPKPRMLKVLI